MKAKTDRNEILQSTDFLTSFNQPPDPDLAPQCRATFWDTFKLDENVNQVMKVETGSSLGIPTRKYCDSPQIIPAEESACEEADELNQEPPVGQGLRRIILDNEEDV